MLSSIDSYPNRVSADKRDMTVSCAQLHNSSTCFLVLNWSIKDCWFLIDRRLKSIFLLLLVFGAVELLQKDHLIFEWSLLSARNDLN